MSDKYFASLPAEEIVAELEDLTTDYYAYLDTRGIRTLWQKSYELYNVAIERSASITRVGENKELHRININQFRNFVQHLMNLTISQRPAFEPRATNTDYKSQTQTVLARGLLDYYMREKRLERNLRKAVEQCLTFGEGFVSTIWNATAGEVYAVDPDTGSSKTAGDIEFNTVEAINVIRDVNLQDWADNQWIIVKKLVNKFDLAAKYPQFSEKILAVTESFDPRTTYRTDISTRKNHNLITQYEFYHKKTDAMPNGRLMYYVDPEIVLVDAALPYRDIPIYRMSASDVTGTTLGYTPAYDLIAIQDGVNDLYSTVMTNQLNLGVQNVAVMQGTNFSSSESGGMNYIYYPQGSQPPTALNLTQTPAEIFNFLNQLEHTMETLSGVNSVARGNPEASLKSGAALALVQAQAIQFSQGLQQSYIQVLEDVGTSTIVILRDFAEVPRIAEIAGKANRGLMREFNGDDLSEVNRVTIDAGNPMSRTTAGKVEMANNLLQGGFLTKGSEGMEYLQVMNTGTLEPLIEGKTIEMLSIRSENEKLSEGKTVAAMATDEHKLHILEHKAIISDPAIRENPDIVVVVTQHIMEHVVFLQDPTLAPLLTLLGQEPVAPSQPEGPPQVPGAPQPQGTGPVQGSNLQGPVAGMVEQMAPSMPQPPTNPLTGEKVALPQPIQG